MFCEHKNLIRLFPSRDYISGEEFGIYECLDCQIAFTRPVPPDIGKYYGRTYYGKRNSFAERLINYSRLRKISKFSKKKPVSILDVGCGNASLISILSEKGYEVSGTEIAPETHFTNPKIIPKICRKELTNCGFPNESFVIITMWHALEHFAETEKYLAEANRILKDGGVLIIEVPNFNSWGARLTKNNWFHLDVPRHLFHFTSETLGNLLDRGGFEVLKFSYSSSIYAIFGFVQSAINIFTKRKNLLFDLLNEKANLNAEIWRDLMITSALAIPVSILAIPFVFLETFLAKSGVITVLAIKK